MIPRLTGLLPLILVATFLGVIVPGFAAPQAAGDNAPGHGPPDNAPADNAAPGTPAKPLPTGTFAALRTKAEAYEAKSQFKAAVPYRLASLKLLDARLARTRAALARISARLKEQQPSPPEAEQAFAAEWWSILMARKTADEVERLRSARWLKACQAGGSELRHLRYDRGIVWKRERTLSRARLRLARLERSAKFPDAQQERRRLVLIAKSNRSFYRGRVAVLYKNAASLKRMRRSRDTDAAKQCEQQASYYEWVIAYTNTLIGGLTRSRNHHEKLDWVRGRARALGALESFAEAYGIAPDDPARTGAAARRATLEGLAAWLSERQANKRGAPQSAPGG